MSLIRPVMRMCALGALLGRTWAEDRVYDSDNTPLVEALTAEAKPYIVIYTDEDNRTEIEGRELYAASRSISLVLEFGVASAIQSETGVTLQTPATDAGMEAAVDILESQAVAALLGDPRNPWAEVLRSIILRIHRIPSHRGGSAEKATRWAARQITIVCDVISDPPPGTVLSAGHPVRMFVELALASSPMMPVAAIIAALINASPAPNWRQAQAWLTLTEDEIRSMGLAPVAPGVEEEPKLETDVLHDEDTGEDIVDNG